MMARNVWRRIHLQSEMVNCDDDDDIYRVVDLAVGVVDDGKEHVEEDEEDKEDVGEEEDWTENTICLKSQFI